MGARWRAALSRLGGGGWGARREAAGGGGATAAARRGDARRGQELHTPLLGGDSVAGDDEAQ